MKKILMILMLLTTLTVKSENGDKINLHLNMSKPGYGLSTKNYGGNGGLGVGLLLAGGSFTLGGLLTSTEQYGLNGPDKKFFEHPGRAAAVITGVVLLGTGIVFTIK